MGKWIRTDEERARLYAEQAALVAAALKDSEPGTPMRDGPATLHTDPKRLRGIPAIGRNVSGAITGSDPEREAMKISEDTILKILTQKRVDQERKRIKRRSIMERDDYRCYLCGRKCAEHEIDIDPQSDTPTPNTRDEQGQLQPSEVRDGR